MSIFGNSGFGHTPWQKKFDYNTLYSTAPNLPTPGGPNSNQYIQPGGCELNFPDKSAKNNNHLDNKPGSKYRSYKDSAITGFVNIATQEPINSNHSMEFGRVSTPIGGGNSSFGFAGGKYDSYMGRSLVAGKE